MTALATGCVHAEGAGSPRAAATPHHHPTPTATAAESAAHHRLLAIDPQARPNKVRLPPRYLDEGTEYVSRVRICVTESGEVDDVEVLEPSIPAVDTQLPEVIARWHYRPLVRDGQPTAFCYPMHYRVY